MIKDFSFHLSAKPSSKIGRNSFYLDEDILQNSKLKEILRHYPAGMWLLHFKLPKGANFLLEAMTVWNL